jgi:STE24 endopeptidase
MPNVNQPLVDRTTMQQSEPTENYQYDYSKRAVARRYENTKLLLDSINGTVIPFVFCLTLFLSNASNQLARLLESALGSYWLSLGAYLVLFVIVLQLVTLPLGFYSGFVVDHRFHLSTQTIRGWIVDELKGLGVGIIFGVLAGTVLYYLISNVSFWWIVAAIIFAVFSIILSTILPFVILPIFYKVTPLSDLQLKDELLRMSKGAGANNIDRVLVADESRKSIRANAFFSGVGKSRSIVLFDTLLSNFTRRETATVVAHEFGHYVNKDIWTEALTSGILVIPPFFIANLALIVTAGTPMLANMIDPAGVPLIFAIVIGIGFMLQPVSNGLSRWVERRADEFALKVANDPDAQASAERRLADLSLSVDRPSRLVELLFYTHPPSSRRIQLAEDWKRHSAVDQNKGTE